MFDRYLLMKVFYKRAMSYRFPRNKTKQEDKIEDVVFYTETLRIISFYLRTFCDGIPVKSLQYFVKNIRKSSTKDVGDETIDEESIRGFIQEYSRYSRCSNNSKNMDTGLSTVFNALKQLGHVSGSQLHSNGKRYSFVEEIRCLILTTLMRRNVKGRTLLKKYHLYVHLMELYFMEDRTLFEKVNDFLNINYKIDDDDILGHAKRGNFGEIIKIRPELNRAIEEFILILRKNNSNNNNDSNNNDNNIDIITVYLKDWKLKYNIDESLFNILNGKFSDFSNELEEFCYNLALKKNVTIKNEFIDILNGDFSWIINNTTGWMQLIALFVSDIPVTLNDFEKAFKILFLETFDLDYQLSLGFLSYLRASTFHFNLVINKIPLNNLSVESLIRFTQRNNIDNTLLIHKYANILQDSGTYSDLCKFMITHSVCDFNYKKEFCIYFVNEISAFTRLMQNSFLSDTENRFVHYMGKVLEMYNMLKYCDASSDSIKLEPIENKPELKNTHDIEDNIFEFLLSHRYAEWFIEILVTVIISKNSNKESLWLKCLEKIINIEKNYGVLPTDLKRKVTSRFNI